MYFVCFFETGFHWLQNHNPPPSASQVLCFAIVNELIFSSPSFRRKNPSELGMAVYACGQARGSSGSAWATEWGLVSPTPPHNCKMSQCDPSTWETDPGIFYLVQVWPGFYCLRLSRETKWEAGKIAQVVKRLPGKLEDPSSNTQGPCSKIARKTG